MVSNLFKLTYWLALALSVASYFISLQMPVFIFQQGDPSLAVEYGIEVLMKGWLGFLIGNWAWFANPAGAGAFFLIVISGWRVKYAAWIAAYVALTLIVSFDTFNFTQEPIDESIRYVQLDHLGRGFYYWESSFLLLGVALLIKCLGVWLDPPRRPSMDSGQGSLREPPHV